MNNTFDRASHEGSDADKSLTAPSKHNGASAAYPWILNPVADLLFCCGGLVWLLLLFSDYIFPAVNQTGSLATTTFILAGSHLFGEAHIAATLLKIFRTSETRSRYRFCTLWQPLFWGLLCLYALLNPWITGALLKLYLLWIYQHFTGQAYGLIVLYCIKSSYNLCRTEKIILQLLSGLAAAASITWHLRKSAPASQVFLNEELPNWNVLPDQITLACTFLFKLLLCFFFIQTLRRLAASCRILPLPAMLILATLVLVFSASKSISSKLWMYLPAFFHATQYLAVAATQHLRETAKSPMPPQCAGKELITLRGLHYYSSLLALAVGLYVIIPGLLHFCGFPQENSFAAVFAVVNLHHFLTDMLIWKLRNPKTRQHLA